MAVIISNQNELDVAAGIAAYVASHPPVSEAGAIDVFFADLNGQLTVHPIKADGSQFGGDIYMGALASGGVYHYYNKAYFVNNGVTILRFTTDSLKKIGTYYYDKNTNTQIHNYQNFTDTFDVVFNPDLRISLVIHQDFYSDAS